MSVTTDDEDMKGMKRNEIPCVLRNGWGNDAPDREWVDKMQKFLFALVAHWNPADPSKSYSANMKKHFMLSSHLASKFSCSLTGSFSLLRQFPFSPSLPSGLLLTPPVCLYTWVLFSKVYTTLTFSYAANEASNCIRV